MQIEKLNSQDKTSSKDFKISLEEAEIYVKNWQEKYPIAAFLFHKAEIDAIKDDQNTIYIRFYWALNQCKDDLIKLKPDMFAVGVDSSKKDNINKSSTESGIYNFPKPCPSTCDLNSPLAPSGKENHNLCPPEKPSASDSDIEPIIAEDLQIPYEEAYLSSAAWQREYDIKSFLFNIGDLNRILNTTETDTIRIYFGLNENEIYAIMVGVREGKDIVTEDLYANIIAPCGMQQPTRISDVCDETSPLYHNEVKL